MTNQNLRKLVTSALLAAMTCVATMILGGLAAGIVSSAASVPFNIIQGVTGILIAALLFPILEKVPDIHEWINR